MHLLELGGGSTRNITAASLVILIDNLHYRSIAGLEHCLSARRPQKIVNKRP